MILEFMNEQLPWRSCKDNKVDDVRDVKIMCFKDPQENLWKTTTKNLQEIHNIYYSLQKLSYYDRPDYDYIREQLNSLLLKEEAKEASIRSLDTKTSSCVKKRKLTTSEFEAQEKGGNINLQMSPQFSQQPYFKCPQDYRMSNMYLNYGYYNYPPQDQQYNLENNKAQEESKQNNQFMPLPGYQYGNMYRSQSASQLHNPATTVKIKIPQLKPDDLVSNKDEIINNPSMPFWQIQGKDTFRYISPGYMNPHQDNMQIGQQNYVNINNPSPIAKKITTENPPGTGIKEKYAEQITEKPTFKIKIDEEYYAKLYFADHIYPHIN